MYLKSHRYIHTYVHTYKNALAFVYLNFLSNHAPLKFLLTGVRCTAQCCFCRYPADTNR